MTPKRLNYTTGQFLTAADFQAEQDYQRTQRHTLTGALHSPGVVSGFEFSQPDTTHLTVAPGLAIDAQGRTLQLTEPVTLDLSRALDDRLLYLTLSYAEVQDEADKVKIGGSDFYTRQTEQPTLALMDSGTQPNEPYPPPPAGVVTLGAVFVESGQLLRADESHGRRYSTPIIPPGTQLTVQQLRVDGVASAQQLQSAGRLSVASDAEVSGNLTASDIDVGGSLNLQGSQMYFKGTAHSHTGWGNATGLAAIENSGNYSALMIMGRTIRPASEPGGLVRAIKMYDTVEVNGSLRVQDNGSITGASIGANLTVDKDSYLQGNASVNGDLLYVRRSIQVGNNATVGNTLTAGNAVITGALTVRGSFYAAGKGGYLMDQFVNKLGDTLEVGDVVIIGANQATLFYGTSDSIPVPEVDVTDSAYDTRICGIVCDVHGEVVDGEAHVYSEEERAALDVSKVSPNQIGYMVTYGAYAFCKVDADIAPIAIGDLLTTSPTAGHAQKVLDRSQGLGAIVGKALGSLASGRGLIPLMVMMQ